MHSLNNLEVTMIHGAGEGQEPVVPPPGAPQGEWDLLMARLEWERNNPYRQER